MARIQNFFPKLSVLVFLVFLACAGTSLAQQEKGVHSSDEIISIQKY